MARANDLTLAGQLASGLYLGRTMTFDSEVEKKINDLTAPEVNATSGVVGTDFRHLVALPRDREVIQTVEFVPSVR